jgi:hypothetical protein
MEKIAEKKIIQRKKDPLSKKKFLKGNLKKNKERPLKIIAAISEI